MSADIMRQLQLSKRLLVMRKYLALIMLFWLAVVYMIWTSDNIIQSIEPQPLLNDTAYVCSESLADTRHWLASFTGTSAARHDAPPTTGTPPTASPPASSSLVPGSSVAPPTRPTASDRLSRLAAASAQPAEPIIYFVTPTYPRREQIAELMRLGQTLMHVPHLHWIVADDYDGCNVQLDAVLRRLGIPFTHLSSPMHEFYRGLKPPPRGVANRLAAIRWIRENARRPGVLYFGDDDNTYDLRLFEEIRHTQKVSMFPVGLIGLYAVSAPVVKEGKVIGFYDSWPAKRQWPVDMAGFAVALDHLASHPNATMPYRAGWEETDFLDTIGLRLADIEPRANNCTEILVWHTQTKKEKPPLVHVPAAVVQSDATSLGRLLRQMQSLGVGQWTATANSGIVPQLSRDGKSRPVA